MTLLTLILRAPRDEFESAKSHIDAITSAIPFSIQSIHTRSYSRYREIRITFKLIPE